MSDADVGVREGGRRRGQEEKKQKERQEGEEEGRKLLSHNHSLRYSVDEGDTILVPLTHEFTG